jgi:glutamine amidotransferase
VILLVNSEVANIGSWENILKEKNINYVLSNSVNLNLDKITKIIFPGVGNFAKVIRNLEKLNFKSKLIYLLNKNIPYLGICVGMQILFNESEEEKGVKGLGILDGECLQIKSNKITKPHNGWNNIKYSKKSILFNQFDLHSDLYFNHSYYCSPIDKNFITSYLEDDYNIITSVQEKNVYGVQFHPEKSQKAGNIIINNFLNI